jgi:cation-transporting ATPase E
MPKVVYEGRRVINNVKNSASLYIMKTLLILTLALTCIFLECEYFFTTNNMLMFEFLISALPSVALSLQPNTNRVKGKFIPYVLSRALPGAFTMAVGILSIYVLHRTPLSEAFALNAIVPGTDNTPVYQAIMMLALTFCGLVMLFRICQPFNLFRTVLFLTTTALCLLVVCVPFLGNIVFTGWESIVFTMDQILLLIIIVQAAFPLSGFLIRVFDLMNPAEE